MADGRSAENNIALDAVHLHGHLLSGKMCSNGQSLSSEPCLKTFVREDAHAHVALLSPEALCGGAPLGSAWRDHGIRAALGLSATRLRRRLRPNPSARASPCGWPLSQGLANPFLPCLAMGYADIEAYPCALHVPFLASTPKGGHKEH